MTMEAGKWSRNLNEEVINESNRSRLIEKQRQLLETKRTRQQQVTITSTRPKSARSLRPASSLSRSSDKLTDNRDVNSLGGGGIINSMSINSGGGDDDDYDDETNDFDDADDDIVISGRSLKSGRSGIRSRINNKRSSSPSPSMSPIDPLTTIKGRSLSSISTTATIGTTTSSSSSSVITINHKSASSTRPNQSIRGGGKSVSSSYEDLKDDVETIKSMDINEIGTELNPLKTILNSNELLLFATQPVSPCKTYQCIIMRDKRGIDRSLYPTYYIYLQSIIDKQTDDENDLIIDGGEGKNGSISSNSDKDLSSSESKSLRNNNLSGSMTAIKPSDNRRQVFLLGGRRRKKSKTYLISNDPFDITRDNCISKLKSNVLGTLFNAIRISNERQRYEISTIIYETNVLGFKGPRKMTVILPKNDEVCPFPSSSLLELWKNDPGNKSLISLKNKTPVWNEDTQSYVLNFHGRVTQPSVKNFQLAVAKRSDNNSTGITGSGNIDDIDEIFYTGGNNNKSSTNISNNGSKASSTATSKMSPSSSTRPSPTFFPTNPASNSETMGQQLDEDIAMQFGRISDKEFTCDVTWPLSILQAFCIALSSFDSKLACE